MRTRRIVLRSLSLAISVCLAAVVVFHAGCGGSKPTPANGGGAATTPSRGAMPPPGYMPPTKAPMPVFYPPQQSQR